MRSASSHHLMQLITGYCTTQAIACAATLAIPDKLQNGPLTLEELSRSTHCSANHVRRLMRALCTIGLFSESASGYHLTPMSRYLCSSTKDNLLPLALFHGHEMYQAFWHLTDTVRTGTPAWPSLAKDSVWDYLREHPDRGALFDSTMRINHLDDIRAIVDAYDFSGISTAADIGGGSGSLLRSILSIHASIHGTLFDLPEVVARAKGSGLWDELASQCTFVSGDFFTGIPDDLDLYILMHVLHDWNDEDCIRLLTQCRTSMHSTSRLLIVESLIDDRAQQPPVTWSDLSMMIFGGRERTDGEYRELLAVAGLAVTRVISIPRVTLIEVQQA